MPPLGFKVELAAAKPTARLFWTTSDGETVKLYHGHVIDALRLLPDASVQCVVTSPPYWGLRDYGVEGQLGSEKLPDCGIGGSGHCGECFVCHLVAVFREVRRVLRDDGTVWLNLGDSYASGGGSSPMGTTSIKPSTDKHRQVSIGRGGTPDGMASGNLVGVPWRVALALQADGWVLRQDVIWHKPAPMPESVRNRCTKAHEYVFLLAKGKGYYCDMEAIKEKGEEDIRSGRQKDRNEDDRKTGDIVGKGDPHATGLRTGGNLADAYNGVDWSVVGRNKRSVWTVSSNGYAGAHFATFPKSLIEPMIKAGTSEKGCCAACGAPWQRIVERKREATRPGTVSKAKDGDGVKLDCEVIGNRDPQRHDTETKTVGWKAGCTCDPEATEEDAVPCVVLDPFIGSGTTCDVCITLDRHSIGIDLSEKYLRHNAITRIEGALLRYPATRHLLPR